MSTTSARRPHAAHWPTRKRGIRTRLLRRYPATLAAAVLLSCSLVTGQGRAQSVDIPDEDDYAVSYAYAAVMGTGTYKIHGRRITMLQAPIAFNTRPMSAEEFGMRWYMPVSIGYDEVTGNSWLENIFDEELVTLSAMPGFEAQIALDDTWALKPFGKLGGTYDFTRDEFVVLGVVGLRTRATWTIGKSSEVRWGAGIQIAGEYQVDSYASLGFSILETGIDYRRDTGFQLLERKVNAGVYYHYQHFTPVWDIDESPTRDSEISDLHEIGVSLGLRKPRKLFGVTIERFRVGYKTGTGFKGWTIGTDFPI